MIGISVISGTYPISKLFTYGTYEGSFSNTLTTMEVHNMATTGTIVNVKTYVKSSMVYSLKLHLLVTKLQQVLQRLCHFINFFTSN